MIQFYKLFSLIIRVFTKPLVSYTKQYHMSRKQFSHQYLRRFFIYLGHKYNYVEALITRSTLNHSSAQLQKVKLLTEEVALEKGVESFYEIIMYSILIGFPLYELYRHGDDSLQKTEELNLKLSNLEEDVLSIHKNLEFHAQNSNKKMIVMKDVIENFTKFLDKNKEDMMESIQKNRELFMNSLTENIELINQIKQEKINFEENILTISSKNYEILNILQKAQEEEFSKNSQLDKVE